MNNQKTVELIVVELSRLLRQAQNYYIKRNLSDRHKAPPSPEHVNAKHAFDDYTRQQAVGLYLKPWIEAIDIPALKLKKINLAHYQKVRLIFLNTPLKDRNLMGTKTDYLEIYIENLEKVIEYLSSTYSIDIALKFKYDSKKKSLMRGSTTVLSFNGRNRNQHEVIKQLFAFRNYDKELSEISFPNALKKSERWMYTASVGINKSAEAELVHYGLKQSSGGEKYPVLSLNHDLI